MVTKSKDTGGKKKEKVKVGKLNLNKETVRDLTSREKKEIRGGASTTCNSCADTCKRLN